MSYKNIIQKDNDHNVFCKENINVLVGIENKSEEAEERRLEIKLQKKSSVLDTNFNDQKCKHGH